MTGDLLPAVIGIALVAAAAAFALLPLARASAAESAVTTSQAAAVERYAIYKQILELEFDQQMGKLSTEDFDQLRAQLLAQAGHALRDERGSLEAVDDEIEREIAAARAAFAAARRSHRQVETTV